MNKMIQIALVALEMTSSDLQLLSHIIQSYIEMNKHLNLPTDMLRDVGERVDAAKMAVDMRKTMCENLQ